MLKSDRKQSIMFAKARTLKAPLFQKVYQLPIQNMK
jgi:hypothetical protein